MLSSKDIMEIIKKEFLIKIQNADSSLIKNSAIGNELKKLIESKKINQEASPFRLIEENKKQNE